MIVPRALQPTYTANDLEGFAQDLGYDGPPFPWDARRLVLTTYDQLLNGDDPDLES